MSKRIDEALALLKEIVAAEMKESTQDNDDPIVDVVQRSPLSKTITRRACRCGEVKGAVLKHRRWLARRSSVDAWLSTAARWSPSALVKHVCNHRSTRLEPTGIFARTLPRLASMYADPVRGGATGSTRRE